MYWVNERVYESPTVFHWIQDAHFSVFCCSVASNSFRPYRLQHAGLPYPSLSPWVCSDSCLSNQWCYVTVSSSAASSSFCLQSFPASGSFGMWLFTSGGQSFRASVLAMNIQDWFPLGLIGLISCCPRDSQESSPALQFKSISSWELSLLYGPTLTPIHDYWKNHSMVF